ncbi:hypothetical protein AC629_30010 [Bradyrhizobium sp. NAS80.1]|nr:hypothetical protein AC629_30010 [Bradyrhizobium sp. NAS80.1]
MSDSVAGKGSVAGVAAQQKLHFLIPRSAESAPRGPDDLEVRRRYNDYDAALEGHAELVGLAKSMSRLR